MDRRLVGSTVSTGTVVVGGTRAVASGITKIGTVQQSVFNASDDQLVSRQARKVADGVKGTPIDKSATPKSNTPNPPILTSKYVSFKQPGPDRLKQLLTHHHLLLNQYNPSCSICRLFIH